MESYIKRESAIDFLRFGAIIYIVGFWHLIEYSGNLSFLHTAETLYLTYCVLGLFCFISGYLLSRRYVFEQRGESKHFYARRFLRLYPMYVITLAGYYSLGFINPRALIEAVFLVNIITGTSLMTLWFISMIFVCYLITPLLLIRYSAARHIIITMILYASLFALNFATGLIDLRLPLYLIPFSAGIFFARSATLQEISRETLVIAVSTIACLFFYRIHAVPANIYVRTLAIDAGILCSFPLLIWIGNSLSRICSPGRAYALSYSAFALYLIHRMTYKLGIKIYQPTNALNSVLFLYGVLLPVTILAAYAFQTVMDYAMAKTGLTGRLDRMKGTP